MAWSAPWTTVEEQRFKQALLSYPAGTPNLLERIAEELPRKTAVEVMAYLMDLDTDAEDAVAPQPEGRTEALRVLYDQFESAIFGEYDVLLPSQGSPLPGRTPIYKEEDVPPTPSPQRSPERTPEEAFAHFMKLMAEYLSWGDDGVSPIAMVPPPMDLAGYAPGPEVWREFGDVGHWTGNEHRSFLPSPPAGNTGGPKAGEEKRTGHWTEYEHMLFLKGIEEYGRGDWKSISQWSVKTKTAAQVASHAQKFFIRQDDAGSRKRKSIHDITQTSKIQELPVVPHAR